MPHRWWYPFALVMVAVAPIALWMFVPVLFPIAVAATVVIVYAVHLRRARTRIALLKWGQVADVTGTQPLREGTSFGATTWKNMPLPIARGWKVTRPRYSGPGTKTRIRYTINGSQGHVDVSGREYIDGVVLADPRRPERALCVTSFPYDLARDPEGNWIGRLRPPLVAVMATWVIVVIVVSVAAWWTNAGDGDAFKEWICTNADRTQGIDCSEYE